MQIPQELEQPLEVFMKSLLDGRVEALFPSSEVEEVEKEAEMEMVAVGGNPKRRIATISFSVEWRNQ